MPDRNEEVTFAIAGVMTGGDIIVKNSQRANLTAFLAEFTRAGGHFEEIDDTTTRYCCRGELKATDIVTAPHPGFMTDWQAPWAVLMTQARGTSTIHETVFESRFSYVSELKKMGAHIEFFDPTVDNPEVFYNFNWTDRVEGYYQGIKIKGPTKLHNAVIEIDDLRAGATLILAALSAPGESVVHGVEQVDRGYEKIEERLRALGARIERVTEE
jgi:UDP-N-acetylglucosamine 1-carboxyvinyltransferase